VGERERERGGGEDGASRHVFFALFAAFTGLQCAVLAMRFSDTFNRRARYAIKRNALDLRARGTRSRGKQENSIWDFIASG